MKYKSVQIRILWEGNLSQHFTSTIQAVPAKIALSMTNACLVEIVAYHGLDLRMHDIEAKTVSKEIKN